MVHHSNIESLTIDFSNACQISHHVVRRLYNDWLFERRIRKHHEPGLHSFVSINDEVSILLVIEVAYADLSPSLLNPMLYSHPILIYVNTQAKTVSILSILSNEVFREALKVFLLLFEWSFFKPLLEFLEVLRWLC